MRGKKNSKNHQISNTWFSVCSHKYRNLSKVWYFICGYRHIWLNLIREDRHKFLHLHMDNRHLSYIFKFLKKTLSYRKYYSSCTRVLMYCTVSKPCPAVFRVHDPQRLCDGRTDGRTECGRPSVRRRRPSVCPSSLSFCSGVVCASVAAALLSCSAAVFFFPSSCRVSSLPVGVFKTGS